MQDSSYKITSLASESLSSFVDTIALYEFNDSAPIHLNPDGHFEFIFQLEGQFEQQLLNTDEWIKRPRHFVGGLHSTSFLIRPENKNAKLISVRLNAAYARQFIPEKLNVFRNRLVDFQDLFGSDKSKMLNNIDQHRTISCNIQEVERFLNAIRRPSEVSIVDAALHEIHSTNGQLSISKLVEQSKLSRAQFRKRFSEEIGMSPKEYSKIIRFQEVSNQLKNRKKQKLSDIAYDCGYFDQSHFVHDFRSITGVSPKHFRA